MNYIFRLALCCLLSYFTCISAFSNFEGSGDETSVNLRDEQLIPYLKLSKNMHAKKLKRIKNKHLTNSTKIKFTKKGHKRPGYSYLDPCKLARCSHVCHFDNNSTHCSCREGYQLYSDGKSCKDIDECEHFNGGCEHHCVNTIGSYRCECERHYRLKNNSKVSCEAECSPPCFNNGECIGPNTCSCPSGYLQPRCSPICNPPCANGGICKRHNICKCPQNYTGPTCLIALCKPNCLNGGKCIAPNRCHCSANYYGSRCEKVLCTPSCENGGICVAVNQCLCKTGFKGARCQSITSDRNEHNCNPHCSANQVPYAKLKNCTPPCHNNGRCSFGNKCICTNGTSGMRCQNRRCPIVTFITKITRMINIHVTETFLIDCPQNNKKKCTSYRLVKKTIPKTVDKLGYKMQCH